MHTQLTVIQNVNFKKNNSALSFDLIIEVYKFIKIFRR